MTTYVWRTVRDNRVREEHEDREGESYTWTDPPDDGHPAKRLTAGATPSLIFQISSLSGHD